MAPQTLCDNQLFNFLLAEGLLTELEVSDLARKVGTDCVPLGQILVQHKIISVEDLMQALSFQDADPLAEVAELCVRHGFCDQSEIEAAVQLQGRSAPHGLLVLLNEFGTSNGDLLRGIATYVAGLERQEATSIVEIHDLKGQIANLQ